MAGPTQVVIGVGEITGVPIEVIPSSDWGGDTRTIRILAQDEAGNQREISLDTQYEDHSWASSPVIVSMQGDSALLNIHGLRPIPRLLMIFSLLCNGICKGLGLASKYGI